MESKVQDAIKSMSEYSALRMFVEDELEFYKVFFSHFNASVTREKKILFFENPNRMRVTYEFDVEKLEKGTVPLFIFLPDSRKNWLNLLWEGRRLTVTPAEEVKNAVWKVVKEDMAVLSNLLNEDEEQLWNKKVWGGRTQLPCFVNGEQVSGNGQMVVEYYDSFEQYEHFGLLFDERRYTYDYALEAGKSHWLYVKAPEKFQIDLISSDKRANVIKGNDPEIKAYRIHHGTEKVPVRFYVDVKVPKTLKWWYRMIVMLSIAYVISFLIVGSKLINHSVQLSPAFAQVGISLVAAIIATRGWIVNDETVLRRVSYTMTIMAIFILVSLVVMYAVSGFLS